MFGLGEHTCEMEHVEVKAVVHAVGREGAQRPRNDDGHGALLLRHGEQRERESELEEGGASARPFHPCGASVGEVASMRGCEGATWPVVPTHGRTTAHSILTSEGTN